MEGLRERFLKTYANVPLDSRDGIILVFEDKDKIKKTITWNVAYLEIKENTERASLILEGLDNLGLV